MSQKQDTLRLFIAVPLPSSVKETLQQWASSHKQQLPFRKWTHPEDYHITLQFLGDTSQEQYEQLCQALASVKLSPFQLQLNELGSFGSKQAPRILWAGLSGDLPALQQLQQQVVANSGFQAEERSYRPHITIARYYEGKQPFHSAALADGLPPLAWQVDQFTIMRTGLGNIPMYTTLKSFKGSLKIGL